MNNISLTIPMDYLALTRASDMLHGLAQDIKIDPVVENAPVTSAPEVPNVVAGVVEPSQVPSAPIQPVVAAPTTIAEAVAPVVEPSSDSMPRTDSVDPLSLDKEGIPWDARIHTASKTRLARGDTWKLIRGIEKKNPGIVEQVKAELLAVQQNNTPEAEDQGLAVNIGEQPAPVVPVAPTPAAEAFAPTQHDQSVVPIVPAVAPTVIDFAGLTEKITARIAANENYMTVVEGVLAEFSIVGGLSMVVGRNDLLPQIDARLDQLWLG